MQHGSLVRQFIMVALVAALTPLGLLALLHAFAVPYALPVTLGVALCGSLGLGWKAAQVLTTQLEQLVYLCQAVIVGDYHARAVLATRSPFQALADVLHVLLETVAAQLMPPSEEDHSSDALQTFIAEVEEAATGNLTVEATSTTAMTAALAQAFNAMLQQFRLLIQQVRDATTQASATVHAIQSTVEQLTTSHTAQAAHIVESSTALDAITAVLAPVTQHTSLAASLAQQTLTHAGLGNAAVRNALQPMHRTREQIQEATHSIRGLGTRSQEIGAIVQLLSDLASRTSVLALNASIEAALAGEAGHGFAVVATEVERLAERAAGASRQMTQMVQSMQQETTGAVTAMEASAHGIGDGVQAVSQAGEALAEVERNVVQLTELLQTISLTAQQQVQDADRLSQAIAAVAEGTRQSAAGVQQATGAIQHLASLANTLRQAVDVFQLPASSHG